MQDIQRLRQPVLNPADPRYASAEQAARLLQLDLNKAFAVVENIKEPGVRLRRHAAGAGWQHLAFGI